MTAPKKRLLVIAKTYPELSSKYCETVCTAAVDEEGNPFRLYPIPFRYLAGEQRFQRYQWIEAPIEKNTADSRPESYKISTDAIVLSDRVPATKDEWGLRRDLVLKSRNWQFSSMQAVQRAQEETGLSLAFVYPSKIKSVAVRARESEDFRTFQAKLLDLQVTRRLKRKQLTMFDRATPPEMKRLEFLGQRVCIEWLCSDVDCPSHSMQILDWEICELARRDGPSKARERVMDLLSDQYRTAFVLGSFNAHRHSFAIIGLWYPKRSNLLF